jgi:hypothetical protein
MSLVASTSASRIVATRLVLSASALERDDALLRAYLLRTLPADRYQAIDLRLLIDDDFFEAACAMEANLLADYAVGDLSPADASVVRGWLAASTEVRKRLALIRELAERASHTPA